MLRFRLILLGFVFALAIPASAANPLYVPSKGQLAADPGGACINGSHYYNTTSNAERCCVSTAWAACTVLQLPPPLYVETRSLVVAAGAGVQNVDFVVPPFVASNGCVLGVKAIGYTSVHTNIAFQNNGIEEQSAALYFNFDGTTSNTIGTATTVGLGAAFFAISHTGGGGSALKVRLIYTPPDAREWVFLSKVEMLAQCPWN